MATKTILTAAEFLESGPQTDGFELVRGELVALPPPGDRHGEICANVMYALKSYINQLGHGTVLCNDAGMLTERAPDTVRGVDVAVYLHPSWQGQPAPAGYTHEAPDLAVEIRSPTQAWSAVLAKAGEYLQLGVKAVWIVDPQRSRITVFTSDHEPVTYAGENDIDGGAAVPGFRCRAATLLQSA